MKILQISFYLGFLYRGGTGKVFNCVYQKQTILFSSRCSNSYSILIFIVSCCLAPNHAIFIVEMSCM